MSSFSLSELLGSPRTQVKYTLQHTAFFFALPVCSKVGSHPLRSAKQMRLDERLWQLFKKEVKSWPLE